MLPTAIKTMATLITDVTGVFLPVSFVVGMSFLTRWFCDSVVFVVFFSAKGWKSILWYHVYYQKWVKEKFKVVFKFIHWKKDEKPTMYFLLHFSAHAALTFTMCCSADPFSITLTVFSFKVLVDHFGSSTVGPIIHVPVVGWDASWFWTNSWKKCHN